MSPSWSKVSGCRLSLAVAYFRNSRCFYQTWKIKSLLFPSMRLLLLFSKKDNSEQGFVYRDGWVHMRNSLRETRGGRKRASQFGTRAIGEDDVPAELICTGHQRESRKYEKAKTCVLYAYLDDLFTYTHRHIASKAVYIACHGCWCSLRTIHVTRYAQSCPINFPGIEEFRIDPLTRGFNSSSRV